MLDENKARQMLFDLNAPNDLLEHVEAVYAVCEDFVERLRKKNPALKINKKTVLVGALLHDIGRTRTQGVDHGVAGAQLMRELNTKNDLDMEKIALICERHIGGGITKAEAARLGLAERDYIPKTIEEKIVCYCDNLVDEEDGSVVIRDPAWVATKYEKKHGKNSEPARMVRELNRFFEKLLEQP
jgi:uncharacterized protein (TIGR00295 family)